MKFYPAILLAAVIGVFAQAEEKTPQQLVEQLRLDDFDQRHVAAQKLEEIGEPARSALEAAARDDDADVRAYAVKILGKLSRATLEINVRDAEGVPVANAEGELTVTANYNPFGNAEQAKPDPIKIGADGKALLKLETLAQKNYFLKLNGFTADGSYANIIPRPGVNSVLFLVKRGGTAQGVVTGADGKPLKDAQISMFQGMEVDAATLEMTLAGLAQSGMAVQHATTDQDGKWKIETLPEGVYTIVAQAEHYLPKSSGMVRVREKMVTDAPAISLAARNPGTIEITVKQKDGKPLAKKKVRAALAYAGDNLRANPMFAMVEMQMLYRNEEKETDAEGAIKVEDVTPGKYHLTVSLSSDEAPTSHLVDAAVEMKPGGTLRMDPAQQQKPGSLKGRLLWADGTGVKDAQVSLVTHRQLLIWQNLTQIGFNMPWQIGFNNGFEVMQPTATSTNRDGVYNFDNVAPGKYAVFFIATENQTQYSVQPSGYVFGIDVQPEKKAEAPDAKIAKPPVEATMITVQGRVFSHTGVAVQNAEVQYVIPQGPSQMAMTGEGGAFSMNLPVKKPREGAAPVPECIVIRQLGYKLLVLKPPYPVNGDYRFEKQEYGSLRVTVTDESGKPLSGVQVSATHSTMNQQAQLPQPPPPVTDTRGIIRLTGLAAGRRELSANAQGYSLPPKSGQVDVAANEERDVKLVLKAGLKISGTVKVPEGVALSQVLVMLDVAQCVTPGANGEFSYDGITPGEHYLTATGPRLIQRRTVTITIPSDPKDFKPEPIVVELHRAGGIAFDCGRQFAGRSATLALPDADRFNATTSVGVNNYSGQADETGRLEFIDVPAGRYALNLLPKESNSSSFSQLTADATYGPFDVSALDSREKIATLAATPLKLRTGSGTVTGRLRFNQMEQFPFEQYATTAMLRIVSAEACAERETNISVAEFTGTAMEPVLVGERPAGFKLQNTGTFDAAGLPAGDYKIQMSLSYYATTQDENSGMVTSRYNRGKLVEVATFTLKDGEKRDLGEIKFTPQFDSPPTAPKAMSLQQHLHPLDKPQEFEP